MLRAGPAHMRGSSGVSVWRGFWKFLASQKACLRKMWEASDLRQVSPCGRPPAGKGKGGDKGAGAQMIAGRKRKLLLLC